MAAHGSLSRRRFLGSMAVGGLAAPWLSGCIRTAPPDGRLHLQYWEKFERFEGEAVRRVVDAFNRRQDELKVHYVSSSGGGDRKVLLAIAGGDAPDLAGLWDFNVVPHAERGALHPLNAYLERDGIPPDHWVPVYRDICTHDGRMWAVPTTPTTVALHWNKALFREAGLDPDRPPQTLEELDGFSEQLTRYDDEGNILQMGFMPHDPVQSWFVWAYGLWFGGTLYDDGRITANHPRNVEAFDWLQSYTLKYGLRPLQRFSSGFGNFASPQNPFFSGKLAITIQGVWLHNYISQYAPGMEYGVAPWPIVPGGPEEFTIASCDILAIPAGLPQYRADAAWEYVKYALSQEGMEMLNLGQRKNTPLRRVSESFIRDHPHPYIELFIEMASYRNCMRLPPIGVWREYSTALGVVMDRMRLLSTNPRTGRPYTAQEALDECQARMASIWERHQHSLALRAEAAAGGAS